MTKYSLIILLAACSSVASASNIPCAVGIGDVTTFGAGNGCTMQGYTNDNFIVTHSANLTSAMIGILGANDMNGETLKFSVTTDPAVIATHPPEESFWVHLYYDVTDDGIDSAILHNIDGVGVHIVETVCKSSFFDYYGECPSQDLLANIVALPGQTVSASFAPQSEVFIRKELGFGDASITRFDNSVGAPEPGTVGFLGFGLVAISVLLRRQVRIRTDTHR